MESYFYIDSNNQQQGPITPDRFPELGITEQTLVWKAGMDNWIPAGEIIELKHYFTPNNFQGPSYNTPPPGHHFERPPHPQQPYQQYNGGGYYQNQGNQYPNQGYPQRNYNEKPDTYLVWAILTTIFCCLPLGIVSIVYSAGVDSAWARGDYDEAYRKSRLAKTWAIWSAVLSLISVVIYLIICFAVGVSILETVGLNSYY